MCEFAEVHAFADHLSQFTTPTLNPERLPRGKKTKESKTIPYTQIYRIMCNQTQDFSAQNM